VKKPTYLDFFLKTVFSTGKNLCATVFRRILHRPGKVTHENVRSNKILDDFHCVRADSLSALTRWHSNSLTTKPFWTAHPPQTSVLSLFTNYQKNSKDYLVAQYFYRIWTYKRKLCVYSASNILQGWYIWNEGERQKKNVSNWVLDTSARSQAQKTTSDISHNTIKIKKRNSDVTGTNNVVSGHIY